MNATTPPKPKYAIIGAGPCGLAAAKVFLQYGIDFQGFEQASEVGGLWNFDNPHSTMYQSAHLISSKTTTEFTDFKMPANMPHYPSHRHLFQYFKNFAQFFNLYKHFTFNTQVQNIQPAPNQNGWLLQTNTSSEPLYFDGIVIASGIFNKPYIPTFQGTFSQKILHSAEYKSPEIFKNKKVLIVGCGNSACDIAVDAVHHAQSVDISVRRGYYFVPKFVMGKPIDTIGGKIKLSPRLKQIVDSALLKFLVGNPQAYGLPAPDYKLYESHPVINSLFLQHIGQGDITVKPDIQRFENQDVYFKNTPTPTTYDLILLATGYQMNYPFIEKKYLNWAENEHCPQLFLNIFNPQHPSIFVLGMVEAAGLGWQGRHEQAELVAAYIAAQKNENEHFTYFKNKMQQPININELRGGYHYLNLDRMSYYVNKDAYRQKINEYIHLLKEKN